MRIREALSLGSGGLRTSCIARARQHERCLATPARRRRCGGLVRGSTQQNTASAQVDAERRRGGERGGGRRRRCSGSSEMERAAQQPGVPANSGSSVGDLVRDGAADDTHLFAVTHEGLGDQRQTRGDRMQANAPQGVGGRRVEQLAAWYSTAGQACLTLTESACPTSNSLRCRSPVGHPSCAGKPHRQSHDKRRNPFGGAFQHTIT